MAKTKKIVIKYEYDDHPSITNGELRGAVRLMKEAVHELGGKALNRKGKTFGTGSLVISNVSKDRESLINALKRAGEPWEEWRVGQSYEFR